MKHSAVRLSRLCRFLAAFLAVLTGASLLSLGCHPPGRERQVPTPQAGADGPTDGTVARFTDVARAAGLHYRWTVLGPRPLNILQTIGNGCAFLDCDNSGDLSILLVGPKLALYKGDGHGHFTDVTRAMGLDRLHGHFLGCATGDYDNDGYDDLYLSGYHTGLLLHNEKGRGFRDVTKEAGLKPQPWGTACAFGDVDGDGRLDLYVANYADFGPNSSSQLCRFTTEKFGVVLSSCGPRYYHGLKGVLYHNLGGGRFEDITRASGADAHAGRGLGAAFADYDHSGRAGLAITNDEAVGNLFQNVGGGRLKDVAVAAGVAYDRDGSVHGGMGMDWGDYDNDGRLDLFVATFRNEAKCLYHNEGGLFTDRSYASGIGSAALPYVTFGAKWADFENSGWLDLMLTNGHVQDNIAKIENTTYRQPVQLLHNLGGRSVLFEDASGPAGLSALPPIVGRGLAVGDFDNDGRMDALVVDSEGAPLLLRNDTAPIGHWLSVKLEGTRSNRDGIGALVTATAGGLTQMRLCHTDGSYLSASDRRVHLGLGQAARVERLSIQWPSGHTDVWHDLRADQQITLKEGSSGHPPIGQSQSLTPPSDRR